MSYITTTNPKGKRRGNCLSVNRTLIRMLQVRIKRFVSTQVPPHVHYIIYIGSTCFLYYFSVLCKSYSKIAILLARECRLHKPNSLGQRACSSQVLLFGVILKSECKGTTIFRTAKTFSKFFHKNIEIIQDKSSFETRHLIIYIKRDSSFSRFKGKETARDRA